MMDEYRSQLDAAILTAAYDLRRMIAAHDVLDAATDATIREQVIDIITDTGDEMDPLKGLFAAEVTADPPVAVTQPADVSKPAKPTIKPPRAKGAKRKSGRPNLTPADIAAIRASSDPQVALAARYSVSRGTVQNIRARRGAYAHD